MQERFVDEILEGVSITVHDDGKGKLTVTWEMEPESSAALRKVAQSEGLTLADYIDRRNRETLSKYVKLKVTRLGEEGKSKRWNPKAQ